MTVPWITLGKSDLRASRVAFGCEQLGGFEWGAIDQQEALLAVHEAHSIGINLFDTADCYGMGRSEEQLGKALKAVRNKAIIATKFGVRFRTDRTVFYDNTPSWIDHTLEESLTRLGTDRIDLYQLHHWDGVTPLEEVFTHLEKKRDQGKIRYYGASNVFVDQASSWPGLITLSLEYSLAQRKHEADIERVLANPLTFIGYGSLAQGLLSGKYTEQTKFGEGDRRGRPQYVNFHGDLFRRNMKIVEQVKRVAGHYSGASAPQIAIAWLLQRFQRSCALVGIKSRQQLLEIAGGGEITLSDEDFSLLNSESTPE